MALYVTIITMVLVAGLVVLISGPTTLGGWAFGVTFTSLGLFLPILGETLRRSLARHEPTALKFGPEGLLATYGDGVIEHSTWRDVELCEFRPSPRASAGQLHMKIRQRRYGWERTFPEDVARTILEWYRAGNV